jgi:hypothetical protein
MIGASSGERASGKGGGRIWVPPFAGKAGERDERLANQALSAYLPPLARKAVLARFSLEQAGLSPLRRAKEPSSRPVASAGPDAAFPTEEG